MTTDPDDEAPNTIDFYAGFEGEPEIRFVARIDAAPERIIRLWVGYFDAIMGRVEPTNGRWTGLARPYNLHEGWYERPWKVVDVKSVADEWARILIEGLPSPSADAHGAVLRLLNEAAEHDGEVSIVYE